MPSDDYRQAKQLLSSDRFTDVHSYPNPYWYEDGARIEFRDKWTGRRHLFEDLEALKTWLRKVGAL